MRCAESDLQARICSTLAETADTSEIPPFVPWNLNGIKVCNKRDSVLQGYAGLGAAPARMVVPGGGVNTLAPSS